MTWSVICEINVIHVCVYWATLILFAESECVAARHVRFKWQVKEALSKTTFGSSGRTGWNKRDKRISVHHHLSFLLRNWIIKSFSWCARKSHKQRMAKRRGKKRPGKAPVLTTQPGSAQLCVDFVSRQTENYKFINMQITWGSILVLISRLFTHVYKAQISL